MMTLSILQAAVTPAWVGPTMAISLAVIALSVLGMAIVVGSAVLRLAAQRKKMTALVDSLQARRDIPQIEFVPADECRHARELAGEKRGRAKDERGEKAPDPGVAAHY